MTKSPQNLALPVLDTRGNDYAPTGEPFDPSPKTSTLYGGQYVKVSHAYADRGPVVEWVDYKNRVRRAVVCEILYTRSADGRASVSLYGVTIAASTGRIDRRSFSPVGGCVVSPLTLTARDRETLKTVAFMVGSWGKAN